MWSPSENREPAPCSGVPIYLAVVAAIALLLVLRRIDGVTNPQFWAEDGSVFFQENLKLGCWRALHMYFRGFPYLGQRLVACAAMASPIASVPLVYNVVAYAVTAASLASFTLPSFRHVIRSDALRIVFCLAVAALPQATELVGNLTNLGWYLGIWLMILAIMRLPRSPIALAGLSGACLLATFSAPLSILTGPLWFTRALHALSRRRLREAGFATVALGYLLALVLHAGDLGRDPGTPPALAGALLHSVSMLVLANGALGPPAVLGLMRRFGSRVVYPIALALVVVLTALSWRAHLRSLPVLLYCAYGIVASSLFTLIGHPGLAGMAASLDSLVVWTPFFSARYHVLPVVLVYLAVITTIDRLPGAAARSIATTVVLAWLVSTEAATFVLPPFYDLQWPSHAAHLARKLADGSPEPLMNPINPDRVGYAFKIELDSRTIAPEVNVPGASMVGPLLNTTRFEQSFVARCPDLSEIDLFFGKEGHPVTQTVHVQLREEQTGHVISTVVLDAAVIVSQIEAVLDPIEKKVETGELVMTNEIAAALGSLHLAHALYFAPIRDSEGKRYVINVTSSGGAPGDSLTLWGSDGDAYPGGEARRNGERIGGDLAFRYGCSRL